MAEIKTGESGTKYLFNGDRVFFPSANINVFPCSRRGQANAVGSPAVYYDPEARLNTERTNRLHTALNGFKDSFILSDPNEFKAGDTLVFVLAGYYIEVKNFNPAELSQVLVDGEAPTPYPIHAHIGLHTGVSLQVDDYATEILYRQATGQGESNYLDLPQSTPDGKETFDFFVGVSFSNSAINDSNVSIETKNLLLFNGEDVADGAGGSSIIHELNQLSLLPKIDHDDTDDSVVVDTLHIKKTLAVDEAVTVGSPVVVDGTGAEIALTRGDLTVQQILVPLGESSVFKSKYPNTVVNNTGITTANIDAGSIDAESLAIGDGISIENSEGIAITYIKENIELSTGDITVYKGDITAPEATVSAKNITADTITQNGNPIPTISITSTGSSPTIYTLNITTNAAKPTT